MAARKSDVKNVSPFPVCLSDGRQLVQGETAYGVVLDDFNVGLLDASEISEVQAENKVEVPS